MNRSRKVAAALANFTLPFILILNFFGTSEAAESSKGSESRNLEEQGAPFKSPIIGKLSNGLTYIIQPSSRLDDPVDARIVVLAGNAEEGEERGVAHLIEHVVFLGTKRFPGRRGPVSLLDRGLRPGDNWQGYTKYRSTVYAINAPSGKALPPSFAVRLLRDWGGNAILDDAAIAAQKLTVIEERAGVPPGESFRDMAINRALFGSDQDQFHLHHDETIMKISPRRLREFYYRYYRPDHMAIIVVGGIDQAAWLAQIEKEFGSWRPKSLSLAERAADCDDRSMPNRAIILPQNKLTEGERSGASLKVVTAVPKCMVMAPKISAQREQMIRQIAESALRSRFASYDLESRADALMVPDDHLDRFRIDGIYVQFQDVAPEKVGRLVSEVKSILSGLRDYGITNDELSAAKLENNSIASTLEQVQTATRHYESMISARNGDILKFDTTPRSEMLHDIDAVEVNRYLKERISLSGNFDAVFSSQIEGDPKSILQAEMQEAVDAAPFEVSRNIVKPQVEKSETVKSDLIAPSNMPLQMTPLSRIPQSIKGWSTANGAKVYMSSVPGSASYLHLTSVAKNGLDAFPNPFLDEIAYVDLSIDFSESSDAHREYYFSKRGVSISIHLDRQYRKVDVRGEAGQINTLIEALKATTAPRPGLTPHLLSASGVEKADWPIGLRRLNPASLKSAALDRVNWAEIAFSPSQGFALAGSFDVDLAEEAIRSQLDEDDFEAPSILIGKEDIGELIPEKGPFVDSEKRVRVVANYYSSVKNTGRNIVLERMLELMASDLIAERLKDRGFTYYYQASVGVDASNEKLGKKVTTLTLSAAGLAQNRTRIENTIESIARDIPSDKVRTRFSGVRKAICSALGSPWTLTAKVQREMTEGLLANRPPAVITSDECLRVSFAEFSKFSRGVVSGASSSRAIAAESY